MADGLQVFGLNEKPPSAKMNKVARRVIIDVDTAASLPTSPTAGMHCHVLNTGELFYFNGSIWLVRPMGWVHSSEVIGTGYNPPYLYIVPELGEVEINGSANTITATGHSFYKYSISFGLITASMSDLFSVTLKRQVGGTETQLGKVKFCVAGPQGNRGAIEPYHFEHIDFPPAGTVTYHATINGVGGNVGGGGIPPGAGGGDPNDQAWVEHIGGLFLG